MLALTCEAGRRLRAEIGFTPSSGIETEEEYQYLREIGVRRGLEVESYLAGKPRTNLSAARKAFKDEALQRNFGFRPDDLPPLPPL